MTSKISSWKGRSSEYPSAFRSDLFDFSIGALYRSSPVSLRSLRALFRRMTGSG